MYGVNSLAMRNLYPTANAGNGTTAQMATQSQSPSVKTAESPTKPTDPVSKALETGAAGNAIVAGAVLIVMVFGLMFLAKRLHSGDDYRSIQPTVFNVLIIGLAAATGIPIWKYAVTVFPIPGVTTWINAA